MAAAVDAFERCVEALAILLRRQQKWRKPCVGGADFVQDPIFIDPSEPSIRQDDFAVHHHEIDLFAT
jgi:hypothetical protein